MCKSGQRQTLEREVTCSMLLQTRLVRTLLRMHIDLFTSRSADIPTMYLPLCLSVSQSDKDDRQSPVDSAVEEDKGVDHRSSP